jgi:hypothetical protein
MLREEGHQNAPIMPVETLLEQTGIHVTPQIKNVSTELIDGKSILEGIMHGLREMVANKGVVTPA